MINEHSKKEALSRLKKIEGQISGIRRMIEGEKYCVDILHQISAVSGALEQVSKIIMKRHLESCVTEAIKTGTTRERDKKIDELMDVFKRFGR